MIYNSIPWYFTAAIDILARFEQEVLELITALTTPWNH